MYDHMDVLFMSNQQINIQSNGSIPLCGKQVEDDEDIIVVARKPGIVL
jgi:hypothetical protein